MKYDQHPCKEQVKPPHSIIHALINSSLKQRQLRERIDENRGMSRGQGFPSFERVNNMIVVRTVSVHNDKHEEHNPIG